MIVALILSGGTGSRLGADIPKQYIEAGGRPVIGYCIECLSRHSQVGAIQIVADSGWRDKLSAWLSVLDVNHKFRGYSNPGGTRQWSILHGLEDIREYAEPSDWALIHDAARPLLSKRLVDRCLEAARGHEGAVPVLPMKDTVYFSEDGRTIASLLRRDAIYAGQAPEAFRLGEYYEANRRLLPEEIWNINGSTEPAVLAGMDIAMFPGDEANFKITTKADLDRFMEQISRKL